jgi:hypothetical protein
LAIEEEETRVSYEEEDACVHTHGSLIKVYVTFLRHKWTTAEDAGTWENKHHRSMGAKMYSWVHAIATAEENAILLTGSKTDDRGMTSPNVAKVETNLQKLVQKLVQKWMTQVGHRYPVSSAQKVPAWG